MNANIFNENLNSLSLSITQNLKLLNEQKSYLVSKQLYEKSALLRSVEKELLEAQENLAKLKLPKFL